ncbi:MAG: hypothetical protein WDA21_00815 [Bacilli bacterium]
MKNKYIIDYFDEIEYKKLERAVKKYNMLAYKDLIFNCYSKLRSGVFEGEKISTDNDITTYEYKLPTTTMFVRVHGYLRLNYTVNEKENLIILNTLKPTEILEAGHRSELNTYKGVMVSKDNAAKDKFKIELLNMIQE